MSFLLFFRGFVVVLTVFAAITYVATQSIWATFIQTLVCAVLLQMGYFLAVLFLIWRSGKKESGSSESEAARKQAGKASGKVTPMPTTPRSRHP